MSVAAKDSAAEGSGRKRKRIRKSKPRTNEIEGVEIDIDSAIEEAIESKPVDVGAEIIESGGGAESAEDHVDDATGSSKKKRKRKRSRNKGEKETLSDTKVGKSEVGHSMISSTKDHQRFHSSLGELTLNFEGQALDERSANALLYAKQYHLDRSNWKFNKAKQEYLIRHLLIIPPAMISSSSSLPAQVKDTQVESEKRVEDAKFGEDIAASASFLPDEWLECIARYLNTIQGQAKQRVMDTLKVKAQQELSVQPEPALSTLQPISGPRTASNGDAKKSVTFADFAMNKDAQPEVPQISMGEWQRRHFEKSRATKILQYLNG